VLSDELPWVTGSIGLLGTRPSYELMRDLRRTADRGIQFSRTHNSCPSSGSCRAVQIDIDGRLIGMRYPYEVNVVADAKNGAAGP